MYLSFVAEATDLPRNHLERTHPFQPHLIRFAGIVVDEMGLELDRLVTLVRPRPHALLSAEAYDALGISLERSYAEGMNPLDVFSWFTAKASSAKCIIGRNVQFDIEIMAILGARLTGEAWVPPCPEVTGWPPIPSVVNLPPTVRMLAAGFTTPSRRPVSMRRLLLRKGDTKRK